jgi:hypothetical protein
MGQWDKPTFGSVGLDPTIVNTIEGPFGDYPLTMRFLGNGAQTSPYEWLAVEEANFPYDADVGYVFYSYFYIASSATINGIYFGVEQGASGDEIVKTAGGSPLGVPYYLSNTGRSDRGLRNDQWYLAVCKIHPSGFGGTNEQTAGAWHVNTGAQIIKSDEYEWNGQEKTETYLFWGLFESRVHATSDGFYMTRPVGYKIDGNEPSIEDMLFTPESKNLVNSSQWKIPITDPMGRTWRGGGKSINNASVKSAIDGPFGEYPLVLEINGDGVTEATSAWEQYCHFPFEADKSYIGYIWIEFLDGTQSTPSNCYLGIEATSSPATVNAAAGSADTNPYFVYNIGLNTSGIDADQWYLAVCIIHPYNYAGTDEQISGIYDPRDGTQVVTAAHDFEWANAASGETFFRALLWSNISPALSSSDGFRICRTAFYERDGTEPSIKAVLSGGGVIGDFKDIKFKRSWTKPATPTGDNPTGWSDEIPVGSETLWQVIGTKTAFGSLKGGWSEPARVSSMSYRGPWVTSTAYIAFDVVTHYGRTWICTTDHTAGASNEPPDSNSGNAWWDLLAGKGDSGDAPVSYTQTIAITGTDPVNLRTLAENTSPYYDGMGDATITYTIASGVTITGFSGGGIAIDTGDWPAGASINLTLENEGTIRGGGGIGGNGGSSGNGTPGGDGGDAIYCREDITIDNEPSGFTSPGGVIECGGAGGGGGNAAIRYIQGEPYDVAGGGGGGGEPNGAGGMGGTSEAGTDGSDGNAGTGSGGGTGGSGGTSGSINGGSGGAGGDIEDATGSSGSPGASGGTRGYAVRKNGHTVSVTGGTTVGTVD